MFLRANVAFVFSLLGLRAAVFNIPLLHDAVRCHVVKFARLASSAVERDAGAYEYEWRAMDVRK